MSRRHALGLGLLFALAALAGHSLWRLQHAPTAGAAEPELRIGRPHPPLRLADLDGRPRDIEEWAGRLRLVNFWASWCPPCREELPLLARWQREYGPAGLTVIGVALDRPEAVAAAAARYGLDYPLLWGEADADAALRAWGNRLGTLPYTVVVDGAGRVRAVQDRRALRESDARELIEPFLPGTGESPRTAGERPRSDGN
ncbi:MAG: hypothetical protein KatS3mg121_0714 [Gammaproteobacteria bacterium]|nr:MAG: hypothetical protein KatS3mg121_0714 [Gammaproteobacteria bacterium]